MNRSMKKVLIVLLVVGCLLALRAPIEASGQPTFEAIAGRYASTCSYTLLVSPMPFLQPYGVEYIPQSWAYGDAANSHGIWTFHFP